MDSGVVATGHIFIRGTPPVRLALHKTECQPERREILAAGGWQCCGLVPRETLVSFRGQALTAECAAIKEVFELGLMVPLCFEVIVY